MKLQRKVVWFFVVLIGLTAVFGLSLLTSRVTYKATVVITATPITNAITSETFRSDILKSVTNIHNVRIDSGESIMLLGNGTRMTNKTVNIHVTSLGTSQIEAKTFAETAGSAIAARVNSISGCNARLWGRAASVQPHRWYDDMLESITRHLE